MCRSLGPTATQGPAENSIGSPADAQVQIVRRKAGLATVFKMVDACRAIGVVFAPLTGNHRLQISRAHAYVILGGGDTFYAEVLDEKAVYHPHCGTLVVRGPVARQRRQT